MFCDGNVRDIRAARSSKGRATCPDHTRPHKRRRKKQGGENAEGLMLVPAGATGLRGQELSDHALNPARVKSLGLVGRGTADSRNQGESHNARALKDR